MSLISFNILNLLFLNFSIEDFEEKTVCESHTKTNYKFLASDVSYTLHYIRHILRCVYFNY